MKSLAAHSIVAVRLLCVACLAVLATGCATLTDSLESPEVTLAGLRMVEAGFAKQRYDLTLNVRNPNGIPLPVRGLAYRIDLAGERFAAGETLKAFTIPANGESDFQLSVTTDLLRSLSSLQKMIEQREQSLQYSIGGELQVDLPLVRAIPFSKSGALDLGGDYRY